MTNNPQDDWRQQKRQARRNLSKKARNDKSAKIVNALIKMLSEQRAQHIGVYLAMPDEVEVSRFIDYAWQQKKNIYLPVVVAKQTPLKFARYTSDMSLVGDAVGMKVPDVVNQYYCAVDKLDLVIMPLVAFDQHCRRIGMGGGFYDRTFAFKRQSRDAKPMLVGVAFNVQRLDVPIVPQTWDVCPDMIITETVNYPLV